MTTALIPLPTAAITTRLATKADLPWIDALHKQYGDALGYWPTQQFAGYIEMGAVLVAEATAKDEGGRMKDERGAPSSSFILPPSSLPLGYCISRDRYLKRDELGVIYQLCVVPGEQRKLVGAALIREVFQRSAYGCRLYCCWCAQDLAANHFWESLGFVPIAFRAGSDKKKRVHIFWQKRIDEQGRNDDGGWKMEDGKSASSSSSILHSPSSPTPYWYPSQTAGGAMRADRLVFPIPPGTHWTEVQAVAVPVVTTGETNQRALEATPPGPAKLEGAKLEGPKCRGAKVGSRRKIGTHDPAKGPRLMKQSQFIPPGRTAPPPVEEPVETEPLQAEDAKASRKSKTPARKASPPARKASPPARKASPPARKASPPARKASPPAPKIDPKFLAANRELRDRYLEQLNTHDVAGCGKYDVSRVLPPAKAPAPGIDCRASKLLAA